MEEVWDPLRKKMVALTPEEKVRQWFIGVLHSECGMPLHMMASEVSLQYGSELRKKAFRADIVVWDRNLRPAVIVECKRPEVELSGDVLQQALRYNMVMGAPWVIITSGKATFVWKDGRMVQALPKYEDICQQL
ncbi:MAG: type I restriction enzyme HsdR N-terminal domain-containing protein [Bacteroidales bacterium]|nr:type I restriction enzyme HsdR N-terminal domain-containing protein [Bacteroidales bacterium]